MTQPGRGYAWVVLHLLLVLLPLGAALLVAPRLPARPFATELAVAAGFVAFALLAGEFALVARVGAAHGPLGTDALVLFHRQLGLVALAFTLAHPLLLVACGAVGPRALSPLAGPPAARAGALAAWTAALLVALALLRRRLRLRHEVWRALHGALALLVGGATLAHVLLVDRYTGAPLVRVVLVAYVAAFLALFAHYRLVRPLRLPPWELVENRDEGADVRTLVLRPLGHAGLAFAPGQFCWLLTGPSPLRAQEHPLSISSSAESSGCLEFSIKALGDWSRDEVPALQPGTRVWVDGPFGAFTPDRGPWDGLLLVAGGIGLAPMRSMLRTLRDRGERRPLRLLAGARNRSRLMFDAELDELSRTLDLQVVRVFEEPEPGSERGLLDAATLRRHLPPHVERWQVFVCGPGPMMTALEHDLPRLGVPAARLHTERFDLV